MDANKREYGSPLVYCLGINSCQKHVLTLCICRSELVRDGLRNMLFANKFAPTEEDGLLRLRVGSWRVIFDRQDELKVIAIEKIKPRGDAYK